jgi:hypothetical protein
VKRALGALAALVAGLLLPALLAPLAGGCAALCHTTSHLASGRYHPEPGEYSEYDDLLCNHVSGECQLTRPRFVPSDYSLIVADDWSTVDEEYVEEGKRYHLTYRVTGRRTRTD